MINEFTIRSSRLSGFHQLFKPWLLIVKESGVWVYTQAHVDCECNLTHCVHDHYPLVKRIDWEEITGVRLSEGLLWSGVTIDTFDGSEYPVEGLWKPDAGKFILEVSEHLSDISLNRPRHPDSYSQNIKYNRQPLDCCKLMERHPRDVKITYRKSN